MTNSMLVLSFLFSSCAAPVGAADDAGVSTSALRPYAYAIRCRCGPGRMCVEGRCVPRCSPSAPGGACEGGAICRRGACDATACRSISTTDECVECMDHHGCDAFLSCWDGNAGTYIDCWDCMMHAGDPSNVCACRAEVAACAVCDHRAFLSCVERYCPLC